MFENQGEKTYVEGFCITRSLMKVKRLQGDKNEKVIKKKKESHEYSVNNSCHYWCALRVHEYWVVSVMGHKGRSYISTTLGYLGTKRMH